MTRILSPVVLPTSSDTDVPEPVYVDIPSVESLTSPESPFINVGQFADYDQALAFARKTFGADQYGRVHLLSSENDPGNTRPGEDVEVPPTGIFTATNRRTLRIIQQKLIDLRTELATLAQVEEERLSVRNEFTKTSEFHNRAIDYLDEGHVLDTAIEQINAALRAEQKQTTYA